MEAAAAVSTDWWSSQSVPVQDVSDSWASAMSACYRHWGLTRRTGQGFSAAIRQRALDSLHLVQCRCAPCAGQRTAEHIQADPEPHIGIQIIHEGMEHFSFGGASVCAGAGDMLIWNSAQPCRFEVVQALHKSTVMIPLAVIESRLPRGTCIRGGKVDANRGGAALLYAHIRALTEQFVALGPDDAVAAKWATVELATTVAGGLGAPPSRTLVAYHQQRVQDYILANLQDGALDAGRIAHACQMSVRYLHRLFELSERTVSRWILEQRLERCRAALAASGNSHCVVKDVAFRWGFNDAAHFGRVFKQRYGVTPYAYWVGQRSPQSRAE